MLYLTNTGVLTIPRNGSVANTFDIALKRYAGSELIFSNLVPFFIGDKFIQFQLTTSQLSDGQWNVSVFVDESLIYSEDLLIKLPQKGVDYESSDVTFGFEAPTFEEVGKRFCLIINNQAILINNNALIL
jgi:hypothetical protein